MDAGQLSILHGCMQVFPVMKVDKVLETQET